MIENIRCKNMNGGIKVLLILVILIQFAGAIYLCSNTYAGGDAIFTYTLANEPYEFDYIIHKVERFPNNNGWMDAGIVKEEYMVMPYDRFNYSSVYWHQRIDNHPLLYYSLVHTICSLFPETYSIWYALIINLVGLALIDGILIRIARFLFPDNPAAPAVLIAAATSIVAFSNLAALARMYMLLALMAVWFLWICLRLAHRQEVSLWEIYFCVLLGTQTHYYYYVFAALSGFVTLVMMLVDRKWREVWRIILTSGIAFFTSLILFPWVVWHIVFNQMDKNTTLRMWDLETLTGWLSFVNASVFNGRVVIWIAVVIITIICVIRSGSQCRNRFWILTGCSTLVYSMVIYTLNGPIEYYATPVYLPSALMMTALVMTLWHVAREHFHALQQPIIESGVSLAIVLLCLGGISSNVSHLVAVHEEYQEYLAFHQTALDYEGADCLYISTGDDNLMQGMWFEFGEYDEFRKLPIEEYEEIVGGGEENNGGSALDVMLQGRETEDAVVLYWPVELELPGGADKIVEFRGFQVAVLQ